MLDKIDKIRHILDNSPVQATRGYWCNTPMTDDDNVPYQTFDHLLRNLDEQGEVADQHLRRHQDRIGYPCEACEVAVLKFLLTMFPDHVWAEALGSQGE